MRILIDILHPAHVHVLKNFIRKMKKRGHELLITSRKKDVANRLLEEEGFKYINISRPSRNFAGMLLEFFSRGYRLYRIGKKFKPDIILGCTGTTIAPVARLLGKPCIVFHDTENVKYSNAIVYPLASAVCTTTAYTRKLKGNHIKYESYHQLAYLHPNKFKPNKAVLKEEGLKEGEKFFLLRFVSWDTIDHKGQKGFNDKMGLIEMLEKYGRVLISSELPLPEMLDKYRIRVKANKLHHLMAFATMVIGESATMASEAAMLGVPAIYVSTNWRGYTNELEHKYGLVYNFQSQEQAMNKIEALLKDKNIRVKWQRKRKKMLAEKIDLTEWMVNFVENFTLP